LAHVGVFLFDADHHIDRHHDAVRQRSVHVHVDDVFALRDAPGIGDFVIFLRRVAFAAEVVAQQVEGVPAQVPETDRHFARRLHPKVDVVGHGGRPVHFDDHIARRLLVFGVLLFRRDVRQQHDHHGHEADQRQQDDVPENRPPGVIVQVIKPLHGVPPGQ